MATETRIPSPPQPANPAVPAPAVNPGLPAGAQAWRLNIRLLVWSLVVGVVLVPLLFFWQSIQHSRHANAILERARALHTQEDWRSAAAAFHQYLRLRPDDAEALVLRAQTFDKLAVEFDQRQQAASLYLQAVRANPDRQDLRLRRAELLHELGRNSEAADEADKVRKALARPTAESAAPAGSQQPDLLTVDRLYAAAFRDQIGPAQRVTVVDAVRVFEDALLAHPGDIELSVGLAQLLNKHADSLPGEQRDAAFSRAEQVIDEIVSRNPGNAQALLARYRFQTAQAQREGGEELRDTRHDTRKQDLADLLKADPDDPDVLIVAAGAFAEKAAADARKAGSESDLTTADKLKSSATENRAAARRYALRLLDVAPQDRRGYLTVAALYVRWNELPEAIDTLTTGLSRCGEDDLDLNLMRLRLFVAAGDSAAARGTLLRIEPVVRRRGPYLAAPIRSRLAEDLELADAQIQVLEGKTTAALPRLKRLAASVTEGDPRETLVEREHRRRLLAAAYSRVGLHDLAGAAYDELVHLNARSQEYQMLAATEWRTSGDLDRAIKRFEAATVGEPEVPGAWLSLAEARLDQQNRKPTVENRDWRGVDSAIKQARNRLGNSTAVVFLEAVAASARGDRPAALEQLTALASSTEVGVAQLPRLAVLLEEAGDRVGADAVLERYRGAVRAPVEYALMKSAIMSRRGESSAAIEVLEQALEQVPEAGRTSIVRRLVELEIDSGSIQSARRRLHELRKANADELWIYETAADLATVARDYTELEACEHELEGLEGQGGTLWRYFRAIRLLERTPDDRDTPPEVNRLLGEIDATRPSWPQTNVLRGFLAERSKKLEKAVESYELALRTGARNLTTLQRLVSALYRQNRFADVASYSRQMGQVAALSGEFSSQAVPADLKAGRIGDALRLSRAAAELRPADLVSQLWYAQCLALGNKGRESEALFRKAIKLAPADARTWSGLVWFYSRERRQADARQALDDMVANVELTPFNRDLVMARGLDIIGDRQRAEQHYLRALSERKTDLKLLEELGRFFLRFDHDRALEFFQQALKVDPQSAEARRQIALLWGLRGNDAEVGRAMELLAKGEAAVADEDRRIQASLLLIRGGDERCRQAVELLTGLIDSAEKPVSADRLLLAKAYTDLAEIDSAQEQYETLLKTQNEPLYQAMYVRFLNSHDRLAAADRWLSRLEKVDSGNQRTLELRVDWLKRSQRAAEIEKTVDGFLDGRLKLARNETQQIALLHYAADLFTRVELFDAAETKYREIVRRYPARYESLATWLAERGRVAEALALCLEKFPETIPSDVATSPEATAAAIALVRVMTVAACHPPEVGFDATAAEEAIAGIGNSPQVKSELLLELGVLRVMQGRNNEAISFYERILAEEPDNTVVMNNLAVVLADIAGRQDEALRGIDKAIAALPDSLELLDTKGLVLVGTGRLVEARDIFEKLCASNPKNAQYHLHLAMTLAQLDDTPRSQEHAKIAFDNQLDKLFLTPAERQFVQVAKASLSAESRNAN